MAQRKSIPSAVVMIWPVNPCGKGLAVVALRSPERSPVSLLTRLHRHSRFTSVSSPDEDESFTENDLPSRFAPNA